MADTVLLIDDDPDILRSIGNYFEQLGYEVGRELTGEAGLEAYDRMRPDVVLLDLALPGMDGMQVLERLRERSASVILLTGQTDIATAVRAMQLGAENFLPKPVDMSHLVAVTAKAIDKMKLRRVNELLMASVVPGEGLESLGKSSRMQDFARQVSLLAQSDRTTVLLGGESGTGKGWVARMIHNLSPRARMPFVEVNCAGLSATFLDSELFGHEKGAFTDAKDRKQGLFEIADKGTIFLDEIGDLAIELQPKLLKVLETKTFRRLGGTREITVDVRLIAATNRDLPTVPRRPVLPPQRDAARAAAAPRALARGPAGAHHPSLPGSPGLGPGRAEPHRPRSARAAPQSSVAGERPGNAERARTGADPRPDQRLGHGGAAPGRFPRQGRRERTPPCTAVAG